ncbi:hypothetical protein [Halopenitus sp. POP-27]|uniref:DUF5789 family protein n=1 Tax=Halopenitus sp. POP-27 TaxID=2994425 RepID=UPI0024695F15|nr:hypothetical protein [Halopenitus sp. POP-27]
MSTEVRLNRLRTVIDALDYPIDRTDAREELSDVTLLYADGRESLAAVVSRSNDDVFRSMEDLEAAVFGNVPVEAVGEPGQSDGDA